MLFAYSVKCYFDALDRYAYRYLLSAISVALSAIHSRHSLCWLLLLQKALRYHAKRPSIRRACRLSAASQLPMFAFSEVPLLAAFSYQLSAIKRHFTRIFRPFRQSRKQRENCRLLVSHLRPCCSFSRRLLLAAKIRHIGSQLFADSAACCFFSRRPAASVATKAIPL